MIFDVATCHQLTLDLSVLASISVTLVAILRAIEHRRNAGVARDSDPAVVCSPDILTDRPSDHAQSMATCRDYRVSPQRSGIRIPAGRLKRCSSSTRQRRGGR